ncbi:hypothetical protein O6H91_23G017700 [Diphasiastrum complanatum]|uniref:Uncharacterized protein n=1 Tax=Diphasiastrum complanatum TaxID=34168 RepID=A0ACC2A8I9_DIPCM|nr:hypothetical protein O6H91_23G017700 [Diphasiastrum complanatum]
MQQFKDSASSHYKKEIRSSNGPSLLLSRLSNADTPGCSSSEKGSKSELYSNSKKLSVNNCSRTQLGSSSTQVASSCYSCLDQYIVFDKQQKRNNDDVNGSVNTYPFCFRSPPAVFNRTDLIENLNGMIDKVQCKSSVSERWNEKFTKVTKESTMECSEAISSCVPSQQASGIHLRNVDCAHTYLLPGAGEELVVIEDSFVIVDQDSNPRERNVKNCYQRSDQNEDFENEVGKFHEITSCDWSLNTDVGVVVKETIHDEFSGNRALMKSKATDELLDDWLIL